MTVNLPSWPEPRPPVFRFDDDTIIYLDPGEGDQAKRVRFSGAVWALPQIPGVDALYARAFDNTRSSFELEGAQEGPGEARIMGVVVWDQGYGTLTFFMESDGDLVIGAQRHLLSGSGSGTQAATVPTTAAAGTGAGSPPTAPELTPDATDMRGTVYAGTGATPSSGPLVRVNFARSFASKPVVLVCAANGNAAGLAPYVDQANLVDLTGFSISLATAPGPDQPHGAYAFNYWVIG